MRCQKRSMWSMQAQKIGRFAINAPLTSCWHLVASMLVVISSDHHGWLLKQHWRSKCISIAYLSIIILTLNYRFLPLNTLVVSVHKTSATLNWSLQIRVHSRSSQIVNTHMLALNSSQRVILPLQIHAQMSWSAVFCATLTQRLVVSLFSGVTTWISIFTKITQPATSHPFLGKWRVSYLYSTFYLLTRLRFCSLWPKCDCCLKKTNRRLMYARRRAQAYRI